MSPRAPLLTRRALHACRRAASAALLALQFAFAVSPTLERAGELRLGTHVEQQGRAHLMAHDESTCVVCSVRSLDVDAPPAAAEIAVTFARRRVVAEAEVMTGAEPRRGRQSRAPPVLH